MLNLPLCESVLVAMTVLMEAEGEPYEGKLAVAYVIRNRGNSPISTVLAPWQFSCWNTSSVTKRRMAEVIGKDAQAWRESVRAALTAFHGWEPDPSHGASHYLNEHLLRRLDQLPKWFDEQKVTARIGRHTFLKGV